MYLKSLSIENLGPIENLKIQPRFDNENPVPIILVGANGSGKSIVLSVLLDAITEARRLAFQTLPEVEDHKFIRVSSKNYVHLEADSSIAEAIIGREGGALEFIEIVSRSDFDQFSQNHKEITEK